MLNKLIAVLAASVLLAGSGHLVFAQYDDKLAVIETPQGSLVMEFFPKDAPNHVANFVDLAQSGFYDDTLFHRIIPTFMIQGGDPNTIEGDPSTWGQGGPESNVAAEFNTIKHNRGIVSMARSASPDSAGSQFFIVHNNSNFLDQNYTVFGRLVTEASFVTLDKIATIDTGNDPNNRPVDPEQVRITKISIVDRSDVPDLMSLDPPERAATLTERPDMMPPPPDPSKPQLFESPELGIVFSAPPGWLLQQPEKINEQIPDVIAVGPQTGTINPLISLTIKPTDGMTFEDAVQDKNKTLSDLVDASNFEILSQEESTILNRPALILFLIDNFDIAGEPLDVKFKDIMIYDSEKIYTLTYANSAVDFDSQLAIFDDAVAAFKILADAETDTDDASDMTDDATSDTTGDMTDTTGDMTDTTGDMTDTTNDDVEEGGGCLIATAAYGSELAPQVQLLREIRDSKVMSTNSGTAFMTAFNDMYYSFSPVVADMQRQNPLLQDAVRIAITPLLHTLPLLNYAETGSEYDILGYGLAVIALNAGMYVAAPAIIIWRIKRD